MSPHLVPILLFAAAFGLCVYLPHAALEMVRHARATHHRARPSAWLLLAALSWGTMAWTASLLTVLALHPNGELTHDPLLLLASLLASLVVGLGLIATFTATTVSWRRAPAIAGGLFLVLLSMSELLLVSIDSADSWAVVRELAWAPLAALALASTCLVAFIVWGSGLALLSRRQSLVLPAVSGVALFAGFSLLARGLHLTSALGVPGPRSAHVALLAGSAALLGLAFTRMLAKIDRRWLASAEGAEQLLRQANSDLHGLAYKDALTQLPNRLVFEDKLSVAVARVDANESRLALLFIDLDSFKPVNDSFGHGCGDLVLAEVGRRLRALARSGDTMARVGGDEFLVLLEGGADEKAAAQLATRIQTDLTQPYDLGGRSVAVSCSIGIALYPQDGAHTKLIARADAAMYAAKRSGGSCYCFFEPDMEADAHHSPDLHHDLRDALEHGEFELFYQPQIDARSAKVTATEALLRWNHPQRGMIGPAIFIPVAERFGLMGALGNWVLEDACRQARAWQEVGWPTRVMVNLSSFQMRQDDLVERVAAARQRHGIDHSMLGFEIAESVAMENTRTTKATFQRLGAAGYRLSIDNFGAGYSSLGHLRTLAAKELKIDSSFVQAAPETPDAQAVFDAMVRMGHALGLEVVAKGVETEQQRDIALAMGCDQVQGHFLAKPMSASAVLRWATELHPQHAASEAAPLARVVPLPHGPVDPALEKDSRYMGYLDSVRDALGRVSGFSKL